MDVQQANVESVPRVSRRGLLRGLGLGAAGPLALATGAAGAAAATALRLSTDRVEVTPGGRAAGWCVDVRNALDLPVADAAVEFSVRGSTAALLDLTGAAVSSLVVRASEGGRAHGPDVMAAGVGTTVVDVRLPGAVAAPAFFSVVAAAVPGSWLTWGAGEGTSPRAVGPAPSSSSTDVGHLLPGGVESIVLGRRRFALDSDGLVWECSAGQAPALLPWSALLGARALVAGLSCAYVLTGDGEVWGWGDDSRGQLGGRSRRVAADRPAQVAGIPDRGVREIAAGACTAFVLLQDGAVWSWGSGLRGATGTGRDATTAPAPLDLPPARSIAAGGRTAFAISEQGVLWGWGRNDFGQVGDGSTTDRYLPVEIGAAGSVRSITTDGRVARARV